MESIYYEASQPGSYGGIKPLIRYSGKSFKSARDWLTSQDTYTLHKPIKRVFPRRKIFAKGINDLFQVDLADMQNLAKFNDGYRYILTCIDVFSKVAYAKALKDKRGASVAAAFEEIFSHSLPNYLQSDEGTEFLAHEPQSVFRKFGIKHYWSFNREIKAACVERFNRTLKSRIFRYLTHHNSKRWIDVLPDIVKSYNNTFHRTLKMSPNEVNSQNEDLIARRMYPPKTEPKWKFNIGDTVRIAKYKNVFEKGYTQGWSEEIFKITIRYSSNPPTYGLSDLDGESIKGRFYEPEIQYVKKQDDVYIVEKVLKTRKRNGQLEFYVKWRGYPDKFNSWTTDVVQL